MAITLSEKQIKDYIASPFKCPLCSGTITTEENNISESNSIKVKCDDCDTIFNEVYKLVSLEIIN